MVRRYHEKEYKEAKFKITLNMKNISYFDPGGEQVLKHSVILVP
jgi:hypothetical protein